MRFAWSIMFKRTLILSCLFMLLSVAAYKCYKLMLKITFTFHNNLTLSHLFRNVEGSLDVWIPQRLDPPAAPTLAFMMFSLDVYFIINILGTMLINLCYTMQLCSKLDFSSPINNCWYDLKPFLNNWLCSPFFGSNQFPLTFFSFLFLFFGDPNFLSCWNIWLLWCKLALQH